MSTADRREYQGQERGLLAEIAPSFAAQLADEVACRECGCSDSLACPDGCWWVEADLCSTCAGELAAERSGSNA